MKIRWLGHASFYLTTPAGVRIVTDPYGPEVSPSAQTVDADIVTVSHEHWDHNYLEGVKGYSQVLRGLTAEGEEWNKVDLTFKDVHIYTVPTYHDDVQGEKRGKNAVFVLEVGDMRLAHLGDLGHLLDAEKCEKIGPLDVLMVPVGGYFTIDAAEAWQVVASLRPRLVLPMHYLTSGMRGFPIAGVDEFTSGRANVRHLGRSEIEVDKEALPPETEVWVLSLGEGGFNL
ncbi:MAG: MBL fold metallo-hydrolase [Moorellaceae bacterium]